MLAYVVLAVGLTITAVAATLVAPRSERGVNHQLALVIERMRSAIHIREALYGSLLHGAVGLFLASEQVTADEWSMFAAANVEENHNKGIARLFYAEWAPRQGLTPVADTTADQRKPVPPRLSLVIRYAAPRSETADLAGFDLGEFQGVWETSRLALEKFTTIGVVVPRKIGNTDKPSTGKPDQGSSLLLLHPVNKADPAQNRTKTGFVGVEIHLERAMAAALREVSTPYVQVQVYSGRHLSSDSLVFDSARDSERHTGTPDPSVGPVTGMVTIATTPWTLRCVALDGFADIHREQLDRIVWVGGIALSLMVFGLVLNLGATRRTAYRMATDMMVQLTNRERILQQLQIITATSASTPDERVNQLLRFGVDRLGFLAGAYLQHQGDRMVCRLLQDDLRLLARNSTADLVAPDAATRLVDVPVYSGSQTVGKLRFVAATSTADRAPNPTGQLVTTTTGHTEATLDPIATKHGNVDESTLAILQLMAVSLGHELERQAALADLDAQRERLDVTLRHIGEAILSVDPSGKIILINEVAQKLLGLEATTALGMRLDEALTLTDEHTHEPVPIQIDQIANRNGYTSLTPAAILTSTQGEQRVVTISGAPVRNPGASPDGIVLVIRDVTDERRIEQELLNAQKLESVGTLAGGIAHDFNNYLTAVLGNISLARYHADHNSDVAKYLRSAETATQRAQDLTQQLLTFARGGAPIRREVSILKLLMENTEFALHGSPILPQWEIDPDLWFGDIDHGQISQVVHNLVLNAIQAMPQGGRLHVSARNEWVSDGAVVPVPPGPYVVVVFQDTGPGIRPDVLPRIFDPYFTTKPLGTGLGLSTCYAIVRNHRGHIAASSEPGHGARFVVHLPAVTTATAPPKPVKTAVSDPVSGRVLVMDDDVLVREVSADMLQALGYQVDVANEGEEALAKYEAALREGRRFDVVIMDLTVPGGLGGKDAMRRLLDIDRSAVGIVSSGYSNDPVMSAYRQYGFRGVVTKPFVLQTLAEVLREARSGGDG
ncbi:MAG: response regulator [Myxococcales bacterium]|nr:response regulator [Myxococcales bacterium]